VWFAFEERPGVTRGSAVDRRETFRALAKACREEDGPIDMEEFERWTEVMVEAQWGGA
jgi:hypothetical protein